MTNFPDSAQASASTTRTDDGYDECTETVEATEADSDRAAQAPITEPTEPSRAPSEQQFRPGASVDDPVAALWSADVVERYREQWRALQLHFVDEPLTAAEKAAALVNDAVESLANALTTQKQRLDGWQSVDRGDTEILRVALRRYRDFLDRLLGM